MITWVGYTHILRLMFFYVLRGCSQYLLYALAVVCGEGWHVDCGPWGLLDSQIPIRKFLYLSYQNIGFMNMRWYIKFNEMLFNRIRFYRIFGKCWTGTTLYRAWKDGTNNTCVPIPIVWKTRGHLSRQHLSPREKNLDTVRSKDGMYEYSSSYKIRVKMISIQPDHHESADLKT